MDLLCHDSIANLFVIHYLLSFANIWKFRSLVRHQMRRGFKVCAWTVNDVNEMTWMHRTLKIPFLTDKPFLAREFMDAAKSDNANVIAFSDSDKADLMNSTSHVPPVKDSGAGSSLMQPIQQQQKVPA